MPCNRDISCRALGDQASRHFPAAQFLHFIHAGAVLADSRGSHPSNWPPARCKSPQLPSFLQCPTSSACRPFTLRSFAAEGRWGNGVGEGRTKDSSGSCTEFLKSAALWLLFTGVVPCQASCEYAACVCSSHPLLHGLGHGCGSHFRAGETESQSKVGEESRLSKLPLAPFFFFWLIPEHLLQARIQYLPARAHHTHP